MYCNIIDASILDLLQKVANALFVDTISLENALARAFLNNDSAVFSVSFLGIVSLLSP